jgi:hypothetical protein
VKWSGESVAMAVLVAFEAPNLYSGLLPSMFTISSPFFHDQGAAEGNRRRIRQGEIIATGLSVGIALAASRITNSYLPLYATLIMDAVLIGCYEYALAHPATSEA